MKILDSSTTVSTSSRFFYIKMLSEILELESKLGCLIDWVVQCEPIVGSSVISWKKLAKVSTKFCSILSEKGGVHNTNRFEM